MARLLYTKPLRKLTQREFGAVIHCNMGNRGSMVHKVHDLFDDRDKNARVIMCWDKKVLLGCSLVFLDNNDRWMIYTYVKTPYRRTGVGTAIVAHARRGRTKPLHACPWDHRSGAFYMPLIDQGKFKNAYA